MPAISYHRLLKALTIVALLFLAGVSILVGINAGSGAASLWQARATRTCSVVSNITYDSTQDADAWTHHEHNFLERCSLNATSSSQSPVQDGDVPHGSLERVLYDSKDYKDSVRKGAELYSFVTGSKDAGPRSVSQWKEYSQLADWGWKDIRSVDVSDRALVQTLLQLPRSVDLGDGVTIRWTHSEASMHQVNGETRPVEYPATDGHYQFTLFPQTAGHGGLIIASSNNGPDFMVSKSEGSAGVSKPAPQLKHWSDVVFLTWMHINAGDLVLQKGLKCIDRQTLRNPRLDSIVETVARKKGILEHHAKGKALHWDVPPWPGIQVRAGEEAFQALLGTSEGAGVAWLLIQHRAELRNKTIRTIRLWNDKPKSPLFGPRLLFEFASVDGGLQQRAAEHTGVTLDVELPAVSRRDDGITQGNATGLGEADSLEKRISLDGEYKNFVKKGSGLSSLLQGTKDPEAQGRSKWLRHGELGEWGWTATEVEDRKHDYLADRLKDNPTQLPFDVSELINGVEMTLEHTTATTHAVGSDADVEYPATNSLYKNTFYPKVSNGGVVVALENYSPESRISENKASIKPWKNAKGKPYPVVKLKQWSDVFFLAWMDFTKEHSDQQKNLRWIYRTVIKNADTKKTIGTIAKKAGGSCAKKSHGKPILHAVLKCEYHAPGWPGILVHPGEEAYDALLDTPNVRGVAWLLIQHKAELGHKTIESIRMWDPAPNALYTPSLLIELGPVS